MSDLMNADGRTAQAPAHAQDGDRPDNSRRVRRLTTETKQAFKTTEFWIYAMAVAGVLIASDLVGRASNRGDYFRADRAWLYIVILTVGYMVSRGIAKAGSRDSYDDHR
jgi:hypothetical protein